MKCFVELLKYCCSFSPVNHEESPQKIPEKQTDSLQIDGSSQFTFAGPSVSSLFTFAPSQTVEPPSPVLIPPPNAVEGRMKYKRLKK